MKYFFCVVLTTMIVAIVSCGTSTSDFYVENKSDYSLSVVYTEVDSTIKSTSKTVAVNKKELIRSIELIESNNPRPVHAFGKIEISISTNGSASFVVYSQDPIDDDKWSRNILEELSLGNTKNEYTLVISNSSLSLSN